MGNQLQKINNLKCEDQCFNIGISPFQPPDFRGINRRYTLALFEPTANMPNKEQPTVNLILELLEASIVGHSANDIADGVIVSYQGSMDQEVHKGSSCISKLILQRQEREAFFNSHS